MRSSADPSITFRSCRLVLSAQHHNYDPWRYWRLIGPHLPGSSIDTIESRITQVSQILLLVDEALEDQRYGGLGDCDVIADVGMEKYIKSLKPHLP